MKKSKRKLYSVAISAVAVIAAAFAVLTQSGQPKSAGSRNPLQEAALKVHFIDVGQGDSILIELPNGQNMLIDAGENDMGETVCQYTEAQDISELDYVVGTHPHSDHIDGLDTVINRFQIGAVYLPDKSHTSKTFQDLVTAVKNKQLTAVKAAAGVKIVDEGDLEVSFLSPVSESYAELNDYSAVVSLKYKNVSFLFTGDAEYTVENELLSVMGHYDVLKVGHHGSNTSSTANFLKKVSPNYAVISVGKDNSYGHPAEQVLNRLERFHATIYRTDLNGTVIAVSDGENIEFYTER